MKYRLINHAILGNYSLLIFVLILVFAVPLFPCKIQDALFDVFFTLVYFMATLSVERYKKTFFITAIVLMVLLWISSPDRLPVVDVISKSLAIVFFILIVVSFIITISKSQKVNARVILESINGYLLMGIMFTLIIAVIMSQHPDAFVFPEGSIQGQTAKNFGNYMYFTLVTMSTLGYGDVLPLTPYAKSIATFISVSGQLYIAVIIALLIGKFAGSQAKNSSDEM